MQDVKIIGRYLEIHAKNGERFVNLVVTPDGLARLSNWLKKAQQSIESLRAIVAEWSGETHNACELSFKSCPDIDPNDPIPYLLTDKDKENG